MPEVEYLNYGVVEERGWRLYDKNNFEKAAELELDEGNHGSVRVSADESILEATEREDLGWSLKCLKGKCGRCAAVLVDGDVDMDYENQEFLTQEEMDEKDLLLPCVSSPETDLKLVYGASDLNCLEKRVK